MSCLCILKVIDELILLIICSVLAYVILSALLGEEIERVYQNKSLEQTKHLLSSHFKTCLIQLVNQRVVWSLALVLVNTF